MNKYNSKFIRQLVKENAVHRDIYVDPTIFQLEIEKIFSQAWIYIGHESQIPETGCYVRSRIADREIILVRDTEEKVRVLLNKCPHRGSSICRSRTGQVKMFRCPYHNWSFRPNGTLLNIPHLEGYGPKFDMENSAYAMTSIPRVESYRGFVFASLAADGPDLVDYLGPMTLPLDNITDRSPSGLLKLVKGTFRQSYRGNWKFHMENANDLVHPVRVHESAIDAARLVSGSSQISDQDPAPVQMMKSNGIPFSRWDDVGVHGFPQGHCYMGSFYTEGTISSSREDPVFRTYKDLLVNRLGHERTEEVLSMERYNNLIYPNLSINASFQQIRVIRPVTVDRTIVESGCFELIGAPKEMLHTSIQFLSAVNSPASLISSDDLEIFDRCQAGLKVDGIDWLDLSRGMGQDILGENGEKTAKGTSELPLRTQLNSWLSYMTAEN
ncbi:MAG: Rieske 2Fe-2S domain-containing protein [Gammaproteobacteria bacterium]|nr:Rieske 2Fe-2S domain-containing protein [Gammaproteobacteria bacterium]